ncbi:MAG: hypothetical protein HUK25_00030, partial [Treponema sp.]|nr:hypothetical protein [Treponema sp.]
VTISIPLKTNAGAFSEGKYKIEIVAKDNSGTTGSISFPVAVTKGKPGLAISTQSNLWKKAGAEVTIDGTVDTSKLLKLERKYSYGSTNVPSEDITSKVSAGRFTDKITVPATVTSGTVTATYKATDKYGLESDEIEFTYKIDGVAPSFGTGYKFYKKGSTTEFPSTGYEKSNALTISIPSANPVTDSESGVQSIEYAFGTVQNTVPTTGWTQIISGSSGEYSMNLSEGVQYIFLRALDNAGNIGLASSTGRYISVDGTAPTLQVTEPEAGTVVGKSAIAVKGYCEDGVKLPVTNAVVVYKDSVNDANILVSAGADDIDSTTHAFTLNITQAQAASFGEGNTNLIIVAKDDAGNETRQSVTVFKDTLPPTIDIKSPVNKTADSAYSTNAQQTFNGTANDAGSAIKNVYYKVLSKSDTVPTVPSGTPDSTWTKATLNSGNWSLNYTTSTQGSYVLYVFAEDDADNRMTSVSSAEFDVDYAKPTVTTKVGSTTISTAAVNVQTAGFELEVTVEDTYKLDSTNPLTVKVQKDDADVTVTKTATTDTETKKIYKIALPSNPSDGLYTYTITGKDSVGKETLVTRNIRLDTKGPVIETTSPDFSDWQNQKTVRVTGTATDDSLVSAVWFSTKSSAAKPTSGSAALNDSTWTNAGWKKATSTSSWSLTLNGDAATTDADYIFEGDSNTLKICAVDSNGIVTDTVLEKTVKMDSAFPVIMNTTYKQGAEAENPLVSGTKVYIGSDLVIGGKVSDTYKVSTVKVDISKSGQTTKSDTVAVNASGEKTWASKTFTVGSGKDLSVEGDWTVKVTVTDGAGKVTEGSYTISVDYTAPTISSVTYKQTKDTTKDFASGGTWADYNGITIGITADDGQGSGISAKEFYIGTAATMTETALNAVASSDWLSVSATRATILDEGTHYIYVRVKDNAGRTTYNSSTNGTVTGRQVMVDTSAPNLNVTAPAFAVTDDGYNQKGDADLSLTGTVSDTVGLDTTAPLVIVLKDKDGTSKWTKTFTTSEVAAGTFSTSVPKETIAGLSEGEFTLTFTAKDLSAKTTVETVTLKHDVTGPELTITAPDFTQWQNSTTVKVIGTADDASVISGVYYTTDSSKTVPTANTTTVTSWTSAGWTKATGTASWNFTLTNLPEGETNTLKLSAVDTYGNVRAAVSNTLKVDAAYPVVGTVNYKGGNGTVKALSSASANPSYESAYPIYISGTSTDSYKVSEVKVSAVNGAVTKEKTATITESTSVNWEVEYSESELTEGNWTITVTVTDGADKAQTSVPYVLCIDKTAPAVSSSFYEPGTTTVFGTGWTSINKVKVKPTVTDTTSGANEVSYYVTGTAVSDVSQITDNLWSSLGTYTSGMEKEISIPEGTNYIYIRATDKAGNKGYATAPALTAKVDTTKPSGFITSPSTGTRIGKSQDVTVKVSAADQSTLSKLKTVRVDVLYKQLESGTVKDKTKSYTVTTPVDGENTVEIPAADLKAIGEYMASDGTTYLNNSIEIKAVLEDNAGNTSETSGVTVNYDNDAPIVTIINPAKKVSGQTEVASPVNGIISFSGNTKDLSSSLAKVELYRTPVGSEIGTSKVKEVVINNIGTDTKANLVELKDLSSYKSGTITEAKAEFDDSASYSWSYTSYINQAEKGFVTTALPEEGSYTLYAVATDAAGNKGYASRLINVDQDTDRPEIKFANFKLIGGTAASPEYMASTTPLWH